jgi:hypothetical protein
VADAGRYTAIVIRRKNAAADLQNLNRVTRALNRGLPSTGLAGLTHGACAAGDDRRQAAQQIWELPAVCSQLTLKANEHYPAADFGRKLFTPVEEDRR